jgi:hypothetical protein
VVRYKYLCEGACFGEAPACCRHTARGPQSTGIACLCLYEVCTAGAMPCQAMRPAAAGHQVELCCSSCRSARSMPCCAPRFTLLIPVYVFCCRAAGAQDAGGARHRVHLPAAAAAQGPLRRRHRLRAAAQVSVVGSRVFCSTNPTLPPPSPLRRCHGGRRCFVYVLEHGLGHPAAAHFRSERTALRAFRSLHCRLWTTSGTRKPMGSQQVLRIFCRSVMPHHAPAPPPGHPQMRTSAVSIPTWPQPPQLRTLQQAVQQQLYPALQRALQCQPTQQQSQRQQQLQQPAPPLQLLPLPGGSIWSSSAVGGTTGWPTAASAL